MKIHFLLPTPGHHPVGGYKVVYEYANGLVQKGHDVVVSHLMTSAPGGNRFRQEARHLKMLLLRNWLPGSWFKIDDRVNMQLLREFNPATLCDADVIVATAWETAEMVALLPARSGKKYYFIQHFEEWSGDRERVLATWRLPLQKIVIAQWLQNIATDQGETAYYVPNGVDLNAFGIDIPPEDRDPNRVVMLYHDFDWKGSADGLTALREVKKQVPGLTVSLFGVPVCPTNLDAWITYHQLPSQHVLRRLYNEASIFLSPSWAEGWPLPPAEAMLCGTVTVLTNIGGHQEYGIDGITTRFVQVRKPMMMVEPLVSMLSEKSGYRLKIAQQARLHIESFTWGRAVSSFERVLEYS